MSPQSSTSTPTFVIPSIFSTWSAAQERDLEAQTSERMQICLSPPPAARVHTRRSRAPSEDTTNAIDDFFGVASSSYIPGGTHDSRHDAASLLVHRDDAPPPYSYSSEPPAYTRNAEQPTLAMHLFKFGFLFPLFWIAGALVLTSPLRAPDGWELSKTEAERRELIESMRRTELKWAKRCLIAFSILATAIALVTAAIVLVGRS